MSYLDNLYTPPALNESDGALDEGTHTFGQIYDKLVKSRWYYPHSLDVNDPRSKTAAGRALNNNLDKMMDKVRKNIHFHGKDPSGWGTSTDVINRGRKVVRGVKPNQTIMI